MLNPHAAARGQPRTTLAPLHGRSGRDPTSRRQTLNDQQGTSSKLEDDAFEREIKDAADLAGASRAVPAKEVISAFFSGGAQGQEDNTMAGNCNSPGCRCQYGSPDRPDIDPHDTEAIRAVEQRRLDEHVARLQAARLAGQSACGTAPALQPPQYQAEAV